MGKDTRKSRDIWGQTPGESSDTGGKDKRKSRDIWGKDTKEKRTHGVKPQGKAGIYAIGIQGN